MKELLDPVCIECDFILDNRFAKYHINEHQVKCVPCYLKNYERRTETRNETPQRQETSTNLSSQIFSKSLGWIFTNEF